MYQNIPPIGASGSAGGPCCKGLPCLESMKLFGLLQIDIWPTRWVTTKAIVETHLLGIEEIKAY